MKNYWNLLSNRLTKEELLNRPSLFRILYLLIPVLVYYIIADITEVILWFLLNLAFKGASEETLLLVSGYGYTIQGVIYGIGIVFSVIILRKMVLGEINYQNDDTPKMNLKTGHILIIIAMSILFSVSLNYLFNIIGFTGVSESFKNVHDAQFALNFSSGIILYGILSPTMEEIIFRGILYNRMKRIFPLVVSMIVSSFLFGVFHGNLVQGVYATIMGLVIVLIYEKTGSFISTVIFHSVANITVFVLNYTLWK